MAIDWKGRRIFVPPFPCRFRSLLWMADWLLFRRHGDSWWPWNGGKVDNNSKDYYYDYFFIVFTVVGVFSLYYSFVLLLS